MHGSVSAMLALLVSGVHRGRAMARLIEELSRFALYADEFTHRFVLFYDEEEYTELDYGAVYLRDNGSVGVFRKTVQR